MMMFFGGGGESAYRLPNRFENNAPKSSQLMSLDLMMICLRVVLAYT